MRRTSAAAPTPLNGLLVSCFLAPHPRSRFTHPEHLRDELAAEVGNSQLASLVSLGCFVEWTGVVRKEVLPRAMKAMLSPKAIDKALASNLAALEAGYAWAQRSREQSSGKASQKGSSGKGN